MGSLLSAGADPGYQVRGGALKKIVGVFRVKNHDFTPKKNIFSNFRRGQVHPPWIRPWSDETLQF